MPRRSLPGDDLQTTPAEPFVRSISLGGPLAAAPSAAFSSIFHTAAETTNGPSSGHIRLRPCRSGTS